MTLQLLPERFSVSLRWRYWKVQQLVVPGSLYGQFLHLGILMVLGTYLITGSHQEKKKMIWTITDVWRATSSSHWADWWWNLSLTQDQYVKMLRGCLRGVCSYNVQKPIEVKENEAIGTYVPNKRRSWNWSCEMQISDLSNEEFKLMVIKMLTEVRRAIPEQIISKREKYQNRSNRAKE